MQLHCLSFKAKFGFASLLHRRLHQYAATFSDVFFKHTRIAARDRTLARTTLDENETNDRLEGTEIRISI